MLSEYSEQMSIVKSRNGRRSYRFAAPLMEGYTLVGEPYREFRRGVKITTYRDDSLSTVDAVLTSNYAIYYEKRQLWEAKGNVEIHKHDGKSLYTQQLFWDERTGKIYSNVDTKIEQNEGRDVFLGEGFESDEEFRDWRFRRSKNRFEVVMRPEGADSTAADASGPQPPAARPAGDDPLRLRPADRISAPGRSRVSAPGGEAVSRADTQPGAALRRRAPRRAVAPSAPDSNTEER